LFTHSTIDVLISIPLELLLGQKNPLDVFQAGFKLYFDIFILYLCCMSGLLNIKDPNTFLGGQNVHNLLIIGMLGYIIYKMK